MKLFPSLLLGVSAFLCAPSLAQTGSVLHAQKINPLFGGFTGPLDADDHFGTPCAPLGDLDADGVPDVAVAAYGDDDGGPDRGAIWILFLKPDGTVARQAKISQTSGGFGGTLADESFLGYGLAAVGDLDGDGRTELAVFCLQPNRIWILFPDASGALHGQSEIRFSDPAFGGGRLARNFGSAMVALGDIDGDGLGDLAIGAPGEDSNAGGIWILNLGAGGTLKAAHRIAEGVGGFTGDLRPEQGRDFSGDFFGASLVRLGDLDGDGIGELGVTTQPRPGEPMLWVLFLDANGLVKTYVERALEDYGPSWIDTYSTGDGAWLGDLDGDGIGEVALDFYAADAPGGPLGEGAVVIAFLRADGSPRKLLGISRFLGGLGDLPGRTAFGRRPTLLGDLNGDGAPEIAVGAPYDRASGVDGGALWILSLDPDPVRNGSGVNPINLSESADPVIGQSWSATLDCSAHASGLAVLTGWDQPRAGRFVTAGEILVGGRALFQLLQVHSGAPVTFTPAVPASVSLIGLSLFVQGECTGAPAPQLSNALDVLVGG